MNFSDIIKSVYVINLDNRNDRWQECCSEFEFLNIPINLINRFSAIPNDFHGIIGCGFSHASVLLDFLISSDSPHCLILEDDFKFQISLESTLESVNLIITNEPEWKVILLSGNKVITLPSMSAHYFNVLESQTASAYIVNRNFIPTLIKKLLLGTDKLKKLLPQIAPHEWETLLRLYASDMIWKDLQKEGGWFIVSPIPIIQRPSYSNIMKEFVNYGV